MLLRTCRSAILRQLTPRQLVHPSVASVRNIITEPTMTTYMTIINQKDPRRKNVNSILSYSTTGFRLVNDSFVFGPMLIFENNVFCWNVRGDDEINEASLEFMFHVHPPLDLIIIGYSHPENKEIHRRNLHLMARKHNCAIELLHVEKAVGTYNFLVETRNVAAALIPPAYIQYASRSQAVDHFFKTPQGLDIPSRDAEQNFDMIQMPRHVRTEVKKIVSKKKDQKRIETAGGEIKVKEETDEKKE